MGNGIRRFDPERDREAGYRLWKEIGWLEEDQEKVMDVYLQCGDAWVYELNGEAEFLAVTSPGEMRYQQRDLPFSGVMAVTTSRIARKQGIAQRCTAQAIAEAAGKGAMVSGLGIFEQGFYNLLGFGNGVYEHLVFFDPGDLRIDIKCRIPNRISVKDALAAHNSRLNRLRHHGSVSFFSSRITEADMMWSKKGFGLGYYDAGGKELTHHFWAYNKGGENGPYIVNWLSYQNYEQLLELLAILKSLSDQVRLVGIFNPAEIQLQDFLTRPIRYRIITDKGKYENIIRSFVWWQMRICDLAGCLAGTSFPGKELKFNLLLQDPLQHYLGEDSAWCGIGGKYIITLGSISSADKGWDDNLPVLETTVGAFTRLWLGVLPASGLAVCEYFKASPELLKELNDIFRLPVPRPDWEF